MDHLLDIRTLASLGISQLVSGTTACACVESQTPSGRTRTYYTLAGVPAALASSVVVVVAAKHLGLLAVLLTPLYALFRRRPRR